MPANAAESRPAAPAAGIADDAEAFLALAQPWEGPLYRHCHRLLGDPRDAEDLCQEALLRAYQYRHRYDPRYRFSTWLFTLATRLCLSEMRRRQVRPLFLGQSPLHAGCCGEAGDQEEPRELASQGPSPRQVAEAREAERLLVAAMAELPPKYRVAVSLFYQQDLGIADIAEILGVSANLVKVRLFRGREQLARLLRPHLEVS